MRNLVIVTVIIIAAILAIFLYSHPNFLAKTTSPSPNSSTKVIFPTSSEQLTKGQIVNLQWTGGGESPIQIFLIDKSLESQGTSGAITDRVYNVSNTGSYQYTIPTNIPTGGYKFQIGNLNSDYFNIVDNTSQINYCSPENLQAMLSTEGAAGNIYGQFTIKNTSSTPCQIIGNKFINLNFDQIVKNIAVTHPSLPTQNSFMIAPSQTIYSQVHYPNGPQCSGQVKNIPVTFTYDISPTAKITFTSQNNQTIPACQSESEITTVQIWGLDTEPISP